MPHRTASGATTGASLSDTGRRLGVRAQLACDDLAEGLGALAHRRAAQLRDDGDRGSMTAEYAMVGGVGAAAAGAVISCIKQRDVIESVLETVVSVLLRSIRSWF